MKARDFSLLLHGCLQPLGGEDGLPLVTAVQILNWANSVEPAPETGTIPAEEHKAQCLAAFARGSLSAAIRGTGGGTYAGHEAKVLRGVTEALRAETARALPPGLLPAPVVARRR